MNFARGPRTVLRCLSTAIRRRPAPVERHMMAALRRWTVPALALALVIGCAAPAGAPAKPPSGSAPAASGSPPQPPNPGGSTTSAAAPAREPRALQMGLIGLAGYWYSIWAAQHSGIFRELG